MEIRQSHRGNPECRSTGAHASVSRACATSPLATRFLRESARPRASSARNKLHNAYRRPGFDFRLCITQTESCVMHCVVLHCNPGVTGAGVPRSAFWYTARRRCGPRAPGEWRARSTAPRSVAPHSKVKVSGEGRGGTFLPLSLL